MSKTRSLAKRELGDIANMLDHALSHLKRFESMGYGDREVFKNAIIQVATGIMMLQEAVNDIKEWI